MSAGTFTEYIYAHTESLTDVWQLKPIPGCMQCELHLIWDPIKTHNTQLDCTLLGAVKGICWNQKQSWIPNPSLFYLRKYVSTILLNGEWNVLHLLPDILFFTVSFERNKLCWNVFRVLLCSPLKWSCHYIKHAKSIQIYKTRKHKLTSPAALIAEHSSDPGK